MIYSRSSTVAPHQPFKSSSPNRVLFLRKGAAKSLEAWVDEGMRMLLQSIEEVEASLEHQAQEKSGRPRQDSVDFGDDFLGGGGGSGGEGCDGGGGGGGGHNDEEMMANTPHIEATAKSVLFSDDDIDIGVGVDDGDSRSSGGGGGGGARESLFGARSSSSQPVLPIVRGGETGGGGGDGVNYRPLPLFRGGAACPSPSFPLSGLMATPDDRGGGGDSGCGACPAHASIRSLRGGEISGSVASAGTLFSRDASSASRVVAASTSGSGAPGQRAVPSGMFGGGLGGGSGRGGKSVAGVPAVVLLRARPKSRLAGAGGTAWQEALSGMISNERTRPAIKRSAADEGGGGGRWGRSATIAQSRGAGGKPRSTNGDGVDDTGIHVVHSAWQRLTRSERPGTRSRSAAAEKSTPEGLKKTGVPRKSRGLAVVSLRKRDGASRAEAAVNASAKVVDGRRKRLGAAESASETKVSDGSERPENLDAVSVLTSRALKREADAREKRTDWARQKSCCGNVAVRDGGEDDGAVAAASADSEDVEGLVGDYADDGHTEAGGVKVRCVAAAASACDAGKAAATGAMASVKSCLAVTLSSPTRLARAIVTGGEAVDPAATVIRGEDDVETDHTTNRSDGEDRTAQRKRHTRDLSPVVTGDAAGDHEMVATAAASAASAAAQTLGDASTATEDTNGDFQAALVPSDKERGAPANIIQIGVSGLARACVDVCGSLMEGASALRRGSAATVSNVGGATFRCVIKTAQCCAGCIRMAVSAPVRLVRAGGRAMSPASADGGGGAAAGVKHWCECICRSVGTGVSTVCVAATATVCSAGGAAVKGVHASSRFCVTCLGAVISPPGRLARAVVLGIGKTVSVIGEQAGTSIVRRCARLGRSGRAAVTSVCLTAMVGTCMFREAAVCGAVRSARCCARGVGCVLSSPVKLGRAVAFPLLSPRKPNAAVVVSTAASEEVTMETSPTTAAAVEAATSPPNLVETPGGYTDKEKTTLELEACPQTTAPCAEVEAMAGTTLVTSNNHSRDAAGAVGAVGSQTPAVWRGGRRRRSPGAKQMRRSGRFGSRALVPNNTAESRGRGPAVGEEGNLTENNEQGSSSSPFAVPAFLFPSFPSLWSRSRSSKEATLGLFRRSAANESLSCTDQDDVTGAAAAAASVSVSDVDSSSPRTSEAEEALALWVATAPSPRVPERSGRRSRALVCGAARVAIIAVPHSASADGGGARGGWG